MEDSDLMHVPYTSQLFEEDGQIVAICPELDVSSFGDTTEEALAALQESVTLFLEECQRMGTLEAVLTGKSPLRLGSVVDAQARRQ